MSQVFHKFTWVLVIWLNLVGVPYLYSQKKSGDLAANPFEMSLEELLTVKFVVPGAITALIAPEAPASITTITADDIKISAARNIYDLIESFVPGAIWLNYEEGPQLGVRGVVANANNKILLRVNGKTLNNKAKNGAMSELEQWDLSDIYKIEVTRGPGSVVYGPGAIAAVISITTHNAKTSPGLSISANVVTEYDSKGLAISHGFESSKINIYSYASMRQTTGVSARQFLGTNDATPGYVGASIFENDLPLDYFADAKDLPQMKIYLSADILDDWNVWARYTRQGSTWHGNEIKTDFDGELLNLQLVRNEQFVIAANHDMQMNNGISLSSAISYSTAISERRGGNARFPEPDHILNHKTSFGESEIFAKSILNWKPKKKFELAVGVEYARDHFGAPWNTNVRDMRLGDNGILVNGANSNAILEGNKGSADKDDRAIYIGDGWETDTYSLFSEANIILNPKFKILLSGRLDKNTYTDWLVSPRVALLGRLAKGHYLKLLIQQSIRMNNAAQLFTEAETGLDANTENIRGVELIYYGAWDNNLNFNVAVFQNNLDVVGFDGDNNVTVPVGSLALWGFESEVYYVQNKGRIRASYSITKQISWALADGIGNSGISYSDFYYSWLNEDESPYAVQSGVGNDLANWPNQTIKLMGQFSMSDRLTLNATTRAMWNYQGWQDGLTSLEIAATGDSDVLSAIETVRDEGTYKGDVRADLSITYQIWDNLELIGLVQNLFGSNNNKRYSYDNGNDKLSPAKVRFVEEPRSVGLRVSYHM